MFDWLARLVLLNLDVLVSPIRYKKTIGKANPFLYLEYKDKASFFLGRKAFLSFLIFLLPFFAISNGMGAGTTNNCSIAPIPAKETLSYWKLYGPDNPACHLSTPQDAMACWFNNNVVVTGCNTNSTDPLGNPANAKCSFYGKNSGSTQTTDLLVLAVYTHSCPANYSYSNYKCSPKASAVCPVVPHKNQEPPKSCPDDRSGGAGPNSESDTGNPINPGTGDKYQVETDYQGIAKLRFTRYYHSSYDAATGSVGSQWQHNYDSHIIYSNGSTFVWVVRATGKQVIYTPTNGGWASDADINDQLIRLSGGGWQLTTADDDVEIYDATGKLTSIQDRSGYAQTLLYNGAGQLQSVTDTYGHQLAFTYDSQGRVATLTDPALGKYHYTYDTNNNLTGVSYPDNKGRLYLYNEQTYTSNTDLPNALTGIIDENNVTVDTNGVPTVISNAVRYATFNYDTVIVAFTDENKITTNIPVARAISTEHAGGVEKYQLSYNTDADGNPISTNIKDPLHPLATDPFSYTRNFSVVQGMVKSNGQNHPDGSNCSRGTNGIAYDSNGNVTQRTDFNGNTTCYAYDPSRNLETVRVEGLAKGKTCPADLTNYIPATTTNERKITTQWHSRWRVPTVQAEPNRLTTWKWSDSTDTSAAHCGTDGVPCSKMVQSTSDSTGGSGTAVTPTATRTWAYTYDSIGQVRSVNGPRTAADVQDTTLYVYDANTNLLFTVTDSLGHVTTYNSYDAHGRPTQITAANGVVTNFTYTPRGQLQSVTASGRTTTFAYYPNTLLYTVTSPAMGVSTYIYDDAHRLIAVKNAAGERVIHTLDNIGNSLRDGVYANGSNTPTSWVNRQYDSLGRLWKLLNTANKVVSEYNYDPQGNLLTTIDHLGGTTGDVLNSTSGSYDTLNRLTQITDAVNGLDAPTTYGYDKLDHLALAKDPRANKTTTSGTSFITTGLDNQISENSPDRGVTSNTSFDQAGNIKTRVDARKTTSLYTYDSLDRLLTATRYLADANGNASTAGTPDTVTAYRYDQNPADPNAVNAIGRLSHVDDPSGSTDWAYDSEGRLQSQTQTTLTTSTTGAPGSLQRSVSYTYEPSSGRLSTLTYPSGLTIKYTYDSAGRPSGLQYASTATGTFSPLLGSITYQPQGPVNSYVLSTVTTTPATITTVVRHYNSDGRIDGYSLSNTVKKLVYDRQGNIIGLGDGDFSSTTLSNSQTYSYDALNRLTDFIDPSNVSQHYDYDSSGNRTSKAIGTALATVYAPFASSNQLISVANTAYSYDSAGNLLSNGPLTFGYDSRNRLTYLKTASNAEYRYGINAQGQRVSKRNTSMSTGGRVYTYDPAGHLIGEYDNNGARQAEHIWLGDLPVAMVAGGSAIFPVFSDHLGTPRQIIDGSKQVRWQWDNLDPFGANAPNTNPANLGAFNYNLRFPGQYVDGESGLFYNYYRTYDPKAGRYTQSDPIGLGGGMNTYGYVGGNPLNRIDPLGLHDITGESQNPLGRFLDWILPSETAPPDVTKVPDLSGMGPDEYEAEIEKNGFKPAPDRGSYHEWISGDGSSILIDPSTGRVVRLGPVPPTRPRGNPRFRPDGSQIPHEKNPKENTHDTGERVKCP